MMKKFDLNKNWKFKIDQHQSHPVENPKLDKWMGCTIPGTVHTDLLNLGYIEDPFYEDNELKLKWISDCNWDYKTSFDFPVDFEKDSPVLIVFDGLDTIAESFLNGESIGNFDNMFRRYEVDITSKLLEKDNELLVKFSSPVKYAKAQEEKYGKLYVEVNTERVYTRKAQYSYGWDWGPSFPTMGIYKPVFILQRNNSSIRNSKFQTIEISKDKAVVEIDVEIEGSINSDSILEVSLSLKDKLIKEEVVGTVKSTNKIRMEIKNPLLWWPCCLGSQSLYNLTSVLKTKNEKIVDIEKKKIGIRTLELLLEENGKNTFKMLVNDKEIFIKGVNWIPTDSFLPRVSDEKYINLLSLAKEANCNMIRIWGGGIYEQDILYKLCDELGLLVWQDFMFACGSYPEHDEFIENVKIEIKQNVERLQHHPSIAMWCGNNECEWLWYQNRGKDISKLPGYNIYHHIIPGILKDIDPIRPYWPSSPYGYDEDPNDQKSGNTHQWNIWSNWIDYTEVVNDNSIFVSEFGFQAPANKETWEEVLSDKNLQSNNALFEFHNKQIEGQKRIFQFMSNHLPVAHEWDDFIYLTQLNQGLALKSCIEYWRGNWPRTNGAIIWQLNDCWPAISWSIIDSDIAPKLSYFFVKDVYSDQILTIIKEDSIVNINFNNHSKTKTIRGLLKLHIVEQKSGKVIREFDKQFSFQSCKNNIIHTVPIEELRKNGKYILIASVYNEDHEMLHRNFYLEQEWKNVKLPEAKFEIEFKDESDLYVLLKSNTPTFFVDLAHPNIKFDTRGFILLPGETKKIKIIQDYQGQFEPDKMELHSLNKYMSS